MTDTAPPPPAEAFVPAVPKVLTGPQDSSGRDEAWYEERTWVMLDDGPDIPPTGVPLSVNGEVCMVLPNEPVHMKNKYVEVMDHAIISIPVIDSGQKVIGHRERHRFPYRKVDAPANAS